ncbi:uncharacterized protein PAF06_013934 [Gastrophryne carolinensis]
MEGSQPIKTELSSTMSVTSRSKRRLKPITLQNAPKEMFYRYPLQLLNGVPLMKPIVDDWEKVENFQARPDDVLIVTYPKAGTTWMQEIVDSIMNNGELEKNQSGPTHERSPFLEISLPPIPSGVDILNVAPSPRLVKTHLPYQLMPKSVWEKKSKVIYVARNAKDNVVSYYFFDLMCVVQPDPGTWEQYVERFLKGDVGWGSWFDHVIGWWNAKDKHDFLYVFYEDMKEDPRREIRRVMNFLGKNLSDETVEKIYHHTSFTAMKENPMTNYSKNLLMDQNLSPFMRKGQVADWMNYFTESQNKHFDEEYEKKMSGTDLKKGAPLVQLFICVNQDYSAILQNAPEGMFYRFPIRMVHGVPLMKLIAEHWEPVENFQARPDDILIATYPKAGTTWMQEIVDSILYNGEVEKTKRAPTHVRSPFLEMTVPPPIPSGVEMLNVTPSPRLVKTHLPYQLVPKSFWEQDCKAIYVARNAKDIAVSYYFFDLMNKCQPDPGTWEEYLEKFQKGEVPWGSWYDHVIDWWSAKDKHKILYMFYEDMKEDPKLEIRKIIHFLGKTLSEEALERICQHTSFNAMKENPMANYTSVPKAILDQDLSPFMRKGEVGDWMNHFTESQNKHFNAEYEEKMKGTDLTFRTTI